MWTLVLNYLFRNVMIDYLNSELFVESRCYIVVDVDFCVYPKIRVNVFFGITLLYEVIYKFCFNLSFILGFTGM